MGPFTYLDAALIAICIISGVLAMYRGMARELLSIVSWIAAAAAGMWVYYTKKELAADIAAQTTLPPQIAEIVIAFVVGLIVLIVVHLVTSRISDAILDSRVVMADRVLGLLFGVLRGFILFVIPYMGYEAFFTAKKEEQVPWVRDAFFRDQIKSAGETIRAVLIPILPSSLTAPPQGEQQQQGGLPPAGRYVALAIGPNRFYMTRL